MKLTLAMRAILALTFVFVAVTLVAAPTPPAALPTFTMTGLDGKPVSSSTLPAKGKWILLYVSPRSRTTDTIFSLLSKSQHPGIAPKTVILVAGTAADAQKLQKGYPDLAGAQWFADSGKTAVSALKLAGVPTLLGVQDKNLRWKVNGLPQDRAVFHSMVDSWTKAAP
jgi:hypothetical protein